MKTIFEAILPETEAQIEDGFPLARGVLPIWEIERLSVLSRGLILPIQATPLSFWPDRSVRALHVVLPKDAGEEGSAYVYRSDNSIAPENVYRFQGNPKKAVQLAIDSLFIYAIGDDGSRYSFLPWGESFTKFRGPYRWDFEVWGWLHRSTSEGLHEPYTAAHLYATFRPQIDRHAVEFLLTHFHMLEGASKVGTLPIKEFGVESTNPDVVLLFDEPSVAGYPAADERHIISMRDAFLPDGGAQVLSFSVALKGSASTPESLYAPFRPAEPARIQGYHSFSGVLPPRADVENARLDGNRLGEVLRTTDFSGSGQGPNAPRVLNRYDISEYPGDQNGMAILAQQLDCPQLLGGDVAHFRNAVRIANDRIERPCQRDYIGPKGEWVHWTNTFGGDDFGTGNTSLRKMGPAAKAMNAASDRRNYRSNSGTYSINSVHNEHSGASAERQIWLRTGKDPYRRVLVSRAECSRSIPHFDGSAPAFSPRAFGFSLILALHASEADQRIERGLAGWTVQFNPLWEELARKQLGRVPSYLGQYIHEGEWRPLTPPATELVLNASLGHGGTRKTIFCHWMSGPALSAALAAAREGIAPDAVLKVLEATLRFMFATRDRNEGHPYKLQVMSVAVKNGKLVDINEHPDATVYPPYAPCDDGGVPVTGDLWRWNSSSVWNLMWVSDAARQARELLPSDLIEECEHDTLQLVAGHDRDTGSQKKWLPTLAAGYRLAAEIEARKAEPV